MNCTVWEKKCAEALNIRLHYLCCFRRVHSPPSDGSKLYMYKYPSCDATNNLGIFCMLKARIIRVVYLLRIGRKATLLFCRTRCVKYFQHLHFSLISIQRNRQPFAFQNFCSSTYLANAQTFLSPLKGNLAVAWSRPWLNISVTWLGR